MGSLSPPMSQAYSGTPRLYQQVQNATDAPSSRFIQGHLQETKSAAFICAQIQVSSLLLLAMGAAGMGASPQSKS